MTVRPYPFLAFIAVLLLGSVAASAPAASTSTVVSATVPSATFLDATTGCPAAAREFGTVPPGTTVVTTSDCAVRFGSSNDSASLRMHQSETTGTAMKRRAWTTRTIAAGFQPESIAWASSTHGWAVGGNGVVRATTDGGATWSLQTTGVTEYLAAVGVAPDGSVWAAGNGGRIIRSTNGTSWSVVTNPVTWSIDDVAIDRLGRIAFATNVSGRITQSSDGVTWNDRALGAVGFVEAIAASSTAFVAVTSTGRVSRSTDGGATWTTTTTSASILEGVGCSGATCVATGRSGTVLWSSDGGATWTSRNVTTADHLYAPIVTGPDTALLVSSSAARFHTTDAGLTWTRTTDVLTFARRSSQRPGAAEAWLSSTASPSVSVHVVATPIADFGAGNDLGSGASTSFFGACLRDTSGGAATSGATWAADSASVGDELAASADCADAADPWRKVQEASFGDVPVATHASAANPATATAHLRFGFRPASTTPAGLYLSPITFAVVAPS